VDDIGKILPSVFQKQIRRAEPHLLEILLPFWPRITGRSIAEHSRPSFFESGVLTLTTDGASWGKELRRMAEEIRAKTNCFLGQPIVKNLRIKTVPEPALFAAARRGTTLPLPYRTEQSLDTTAIPDLEVATALANSYSKYFNRPRR